MNIKNPSEYISGILQVLASDKKRIGFLCGSGTSFASKHQGNLYVPNINELTDNVLEAIKTGENQLVFNALESIVSEISNPNIETILDLIEKKIEAVGADKLNNLSKEGLTNLLGLLKSKIFDSVSVITLETSEEEIAKLPHNDFAKWIKKTDRKYPIEIFTTNYDYFFESAFELNEIPYYDGFTGSLSPFFNTLSVEDINYLPKETKLWKIHGSLGWKVHNKKVVRCKTDPKNKELLIYPSSLKYSNSKKMPYIALVDRLCNFLEQEDSILIIIGYSFGDEHINERIITTIKKSRNSHVFAFIYDEVIYENECTYFLENDTRFKDLADQSSRISFIGMQGAFIGGIFYKWYFDSEKLESTNDFSKYIKVKEDNTFEKLLLPDFITFTQFISSMISEANVGE